MKNDHRSKFSNLSNWKEEAWKNQGFKGIRTRDLRDTGAMLYQLSYSNATEADYLQFILPEVCHVSSRPQSDWQSRPTLHLGSVCMKCVTLNDTTSHCVHFFSEISTSVQYRETTYLFFSAPVLSDNKELMLNLWAQKLKHCTIHRILVTSCMFALWVFFYCPLSPLYSKD